MDKIEIDAFQLKADTVPKWFSEKGGLCLLSEYVSRWEGPHLDGYQLVGAITQHDGGTVDSPCRTFWLFLPWQDCATKPEYLLINRGEEVVRYALKRLEKGHTPMRIWKNVLLQGSPPENN